MNLRITIPDHLNALLTVRAAECGKDVESFIVDSLQEQLELAAPQPNETGSTFEQWLSDTRKLVPPLSQVVDDSRESIYAGCGE